MKLRHPVILATMALSLAACGTPPNPGYTQIRSDAKPFPAADRECWAAGMGINGAPGVDATRTAGYFQCMERAGWVDKRTIF